MEANESSFDHRKRAIEQWAAAWSARDPERLLQLFTADLVYEDVPMGAICRGTTELRAFAESVFARLSDVSFELQSIFADGSKGGAEWVMRVARAGRHAEVRGASLFDFDGDRIRRCSDYWDMATYVRQLDVVV